MPEARKIKCRIIEKIWLTPTVVRLRFEPSKRFIFSPGQFLSIYIPSAAASERAEQGQRASRERRAYSFAAPFRAAPGHEALAGYELCIKHVPDGPGSSFMAQLRVGDVFEATAPYGDFLYEPSNNPNVCFVSTGTGVAPFRAIALSQAFADARPKRVFSAFGARSEEEIVYPGFFESLGFEHEVCLSNPRLEWKGYHGRVTRWIQDLPMTFPWHTTDFYICGNGQMVQDARELLMHGHGVSQRNIHAEIYFETHGGPSARVVSIGKSTTVSEGATPNTQKKSAA